jgi:SAM-dependent methyltransferase
VQPSSMPVDAWASGTSYEAFIGRWSRLVAPEFLGWLGVAAGARWLDVGCGTGALTGAVLASCSPASITGVDPAPAFLEHAVGALTDPRVTLRQGGAEALPLDDAAVDATVSGLVLNFVPDQPAALREMRRVTRPGGTVAAYVWDYTSGMQLLLFFWAAAVALNPAAAAQQEATRFELNRPDRLRALFTGAGLDAVDVGEVVVPTPFASFEEYWTPFLAGTGPAPAYTAALGEGERAALREELRGRLPIEDDGSIRLTARAWTVKGTVA